MPAADPPSGTPAPQSAPGGTHAGGRDTPDLSALTALLGTLWRYRLTFAGVSGLVLALAALATQQLAPSYRATAEILLTPPAPRARPATETAAPAARPRVDIASEIEVLTSRRLLGEVAAAQDLVRVPAFNPALGREPGLLHALGLAAPRAPIPPETQRARTVGALAERLTVRPRGQSKVIAVTVAAGGAERAARLANAVARRYLDVRAETRRRSARKVSRELRAQVAELRESLEAAERKAARYRRKAGLLRPDGADGPAARVAALTRKLAQARSARDTARAKLAQAERARRDGSQSGSGVLASEGLAKRRAKVAELRRKRADLAATYGREHPKIVRVREALAKARAAVADAEARRRAGLRADAETARRRVRRLRDRLATAKQRAADRQARAVRLSELDRRVAAQRQVYETLLAQLKQRQLGPASPRPSARIISAAEPPGAPASPNVTLLMALATLAAVPAGAVAALLRAQLDTGIANRAEAERATGLPALATVPEAPAAGRRAHPADRVITGPAGMFPEALRRLAAALRAARAERTVTSVLVTAADTHEGKSTLALGLARTWAQRGERVLLLEADLRKPRLARRLGIPRGPGLAEVLAGEAGAGDGIGLDPAGPLHMLPAGRSGAERAARLAGPELPALLQAAAQHYDRIVLDAPPVLPVHDTVHLAAAADTCVLAVRWRRTPPATVQQAVTELTRAGADPAGVALTRVAPGRYGATGAGDAAAYGPRARAYYAG